MKLNSLGDHTMRVRVARFALHGTYVDNGTRRVKPTALTAKAALRRQRQFVRDRWARNSQAILAGKLLLSAKAAREVRQRL